MPGVALVPSAEDQDVGDAFMRELVAAGEERWVAGTVLETIIRSRVGGESITDLAAEHASRKVLLRRRWWAETRLRELTLAGVSSRRRVGLALRWVVVAPSYTKYVRLNDIEGRGTPRNVLRLCELTC